MAYIDGFLAAVADDAKEAYRAHAEKAWELFAGWGAVSSWECWGDDVPEGELTSFPMAVRAEPGETVVFSWIEWPDKATRDAAWQKMMSDPEVGAQMGEMPFDGKRMIFGGFAPIMQKGPAA